MGKMTSRVQKSGCHTTKREGSPTMSKNGMKPSQVLESTFLFFAQKDATAIIIESFKNSVGCIEKGIPGISNQPRFPLIVIPTTRTSTRRTMAMILIIFDCFFHQRNGILIATIIAARPIHAWRIFLTIKRQLLGSGKLPVSTRRLVIRYES